MVRLHLRVDFMRAAEPRESPALPLLEEFQNLRFVLTHGRFIEGGGFDVLDRTTARLSRESATRLDTAAESRGVVDLVLAWAQ